MLVKLHGIKAVFSKSWVSDKLFHKPLSCDSILPLISCALRVHQKSLNVLFHKHEASLIAQLVKNLPAMLETSVWFLGQEDLLEKGQATHPVFLGFSCDQLVKNQPAMQETWVWSLGWKDTLEMGKATHFSLENSGLENSMDYIYRLRGHKESETIEQLSFHFTS